MAGAHSRNKGANAERDVIKLLQPVLDQGYTQMRNAGYAVGAAPRLQRNTLQSDKGGCDIAGLPWAAIEVKHHAVLLLTGWWAQCVAQAKAVGSEPVLIYRRTGASWHVRMRATLPAVGHFQVPCVADLTMPEFLVYFYRRSCYEAHLVLERSKVTGVNL